MLVLLLFGILVPVACAAATCWFVFKYLPPAIVKALQETLRHERPTP
jgi:hypothetical protein